ASSRGYKVIVALLLKKGADVNTRPYSNVLQVALARGYKALVVLLVKKGAKGLG
ncbi:hypothetical protein F5882DRAFT_310864, partial [Hyaloscypha sp. PMI_1271]